MWLVKSKWPYWTRQNSQNLSGEFKPTKNLSIEVWGVNLVKVVSFDTFNLYSESGQNFLDEMKEGLRNWCVTS